MALAATARMEVECVHNAPTSPPPLDDILIGPERDKTEKRKVQNKWQPNGWKAGDWSEKEAKSIATPISLCFADRLFRAVIEVWPLRALYLERLRFQRKTVNSARPKSLLSNKMEFSDKAKAIIAATKCDYKQVGTSGLRVSVPILGCMGFGDPNGPQGWLLGEEKALPLLKAAWERGINTWDTANNYSNGESEILIGKAIQKYEIPRRKLVIMTKCWAFVGDEPDIPGFFPPLGPQMADIQQTKEYINQSGLSRTAIFTAVDASLERLQTSYIDLLQIHKFDASVPMEETMKALHDLVQIGKVRYIGASSMLAVEFAMLQFTAERHGWTKFISMQNQYNLLYRENEREMNTFCNMTGVGILPYSPLCRGHLARPLKSRGSSTRSKLEEERGTMRTTGWGEPDESIINRVGGVARRRGWSMSDVSLAWLNRRITSPIVGVSSVDRLDEILESRGKVLTDSEEECLEELYVPKPFLGLSSPTEPSLRTFTIAVDKKYLDNIPERLSTTFLEAGI
ncbi:hypothetical protein FQN57_006816 [Myotisia sp. PD_48]|nr:hypothetical protein FQN57_006816 [Myotisia sp. PD_48]